jgi:type II secretory ATPase GspE/PulE/Tfp pilus assembly ATPase PilB-like protein
VSTLPTQFGESVVLRVLDRSDITLDLEALGFAEADRTAFEQAIHRPHGMVLVTGPTGSGKTTTLYAALQAVANERLNVQTIEDPIEYEIPGINQAQARPDIGFAFADALRAFLRQDPDVIMVGEIRDQETAQIAIRAALTGHLVLSTLHTNDAPSAPGRLIDMGVPPYLVASSVTLIMAQRLVRTICPECATERPIGEEQREALGLSSSACTGQHGTGQHGTGCPACHDTGYKGRTAVSEVMPMSKTLARSVADGEDTRVIRDQAVQEGMRTLRSSAAAKVEGGITTPEEALRHTV